MTQPITKRTVTKEITRDDSGQIILEKTTEVYEYGPAVTVGDWPQPYQPWWQTPVISKTANTLDLVKDGLEFINTHYGVDGYNDSKRFGE